jgi:hypothetical protein
VAVTGRFASRPVTCPIGGGGRLVDVRDPIARGLAAVDERVGKRRRRQVVGDGHQADIGNVHQGGDAGARRLFGALADHGHEI